MATQTTTEFQMRMAQYKEWGYVMVEGNDAMGSGYVFFRSNIHANVPSPIQFVFLRLLPNGQTKEISFAMPFNAWKNILVAAITDI